MAYTIPVIVTLFGLLCAVSNQLPIENDESESSTKANETNYRLPNTTVPIHYDLKFILDIDTTFTFDGETVVKFEVLEPTWDVALHSENLTLNENGTRLTLKNGDTITPKWHEQDNETGILVIHFTDRLEIGEYSLNLQYSGALTDDLYGFYKSQYKDDQGNTLWLAATQFEPIFARRVFPCWDEPALKATFNISIKHSPNFTAISNMPIQQESEVDEVDGKMWTSFKRTPVMSTYLVAFVVADFANISNDDGTIRVWSRKDLVPYLSYAHDIARKASKELERYTNSTVRVPKMDHVALPSHPKGAMENWGLITYPERNIILKEDEASVVQKFRIIETVIHELAHQWFGNVVSPSWWSHIWLNEGFASYFQYCTMSKILNDSRAMDYLVIGIVQGCLSTDTHRHMNSIQADIKTPEQIQEVFSQAVYKKAPAILHMLSNIISPEVFQAGIVKYLNKHEYDSAESNCLWEAMQSALDESDTSHNGFKVKEVMDTWIKQKRFPLIYVTRDYSAGTITLMQKDFGLIDVPFNFDKKAFEDNDDRYEWWVPINYATETESDFSNTRPMHWLKPTENLTIDGISADDWVIVNKQQSGYYRVTYDATNWKKIARYLRSENFIKIHVLNRAQIIDDISQLLINEHVEPSIFLDVVTYLFQETDYVPWYPMFNFFGDVDHLLKSPSTEQIKAFILSMMGNLIKDVGVEERENDDPHTILKRSQTLEWACIFGHEECRQAATTKFMEHFENPKANKISPNQKTWVYDHGMRWANESVWNKVFEWCVKNPSKEVFRALSFTENPALLTKYLNTTLSNDTAISEEHREQMISIALNNSPLTAPLLDAVLNFYEQRWHEINERFKYANHQIHGILHQVYTEQQVEKARRLCTRINEEYCTTQSFYEKKLIQISYRNDAIKLWNTLINNQ